MKRVGILFVTASAALCLAAGLAGDPGGRLLGAEPASAANAQTSPVEPLSANDVSWLFPAPARLSDLISMGDLKAHGNPVWSDAAFREFLAIATGPAGRVAGTDQRIHLPAEVRSKRAWYIAGVRFDPSAPGFSPEIREQFGQELQVRLIVQPVTRNADGTLNVHDIAAHLVFEFNTGKDERPAAEGCFPRPQPDLMLSKQIAQELIEVRTKVGKDETGKDKTSGQPLGMHPGLIDQNTAGTVRQAMKALLERHLSSQRLGFMTVTAIQEDALKRWIFLGMVNLKVHARFYPLSSKLGFVPMPAAALDGHQYAQMYSPAAQLQNAVVPIPYANNDYRDEHGNFAITCRNGGNAIAGPSLERRVGYATADILDKRPLTDPNPLVHKEPNTSTMQTVFDVIVNPDRSHVFNTDCISCHTETPLFQGRLSHTSIPGIHSSVLPGENIYNVRAFGWAPQPSDDGNRDISIQATASRRTARETTNVADYFNLLLGIGTTASASSHPIATNATNSKQVTERRVQMRGRPKEKASDLKFLLPKRLGGGQDPTPDPGHPDLDTHAHPDDLFADPLSRMNPPDADGENRLLAKAIQAVFDASKKPVDAGVPRFVLTWRMYPNKDSMVVGTAGNCGCGCSCGG
jgi:hypothetical protein